MPRKSLLILALLLACAELRTRAATPEDRLTAAQESFDALEHEKSQRLSGYQPSYVAAVVEDGVWHPQFFLSLQYPFPIFGDKSLGKFSMPGVYFTYEGLFDYYAGVRLSSPLISRRQNPGIRLSLENQDVKAEGWNAYHLGYYHESNGQSLDERNDYLRAGPYAQDQVSRGWDYVGLSARYQNYLDLSRLRLGEALFRVDPSLRLFTGYAGVGGKMEEDDFWNPSPRHPHIGEYDGIRLLLSLEKAFKPTWGWLGLHYWGLTAELRTGYDYGKVAANWSGRYALTMRFGIVPLYAFYFDGYGKYISDYSARDSMFGVGLGLL